MLSCHAPLFPSFSRLVQKRLDGPHHFGIPVAADVVTSPSNMHHLPVFPELCRLLGGFGRDNRTQLGIACNEQNGTLDACHDLAPSEGNHGGMCRLNAPVTAMAPPAHKEIETSPVEVPESP